MGWATKLYKKDGKGGKAESSTHRTDVSAISDHLKQKRAEQQREKASGARRRGMNKTQLYARLAKYEAFGSKAAAKRFVRAYIEAATEVLAKGESLKIRGFGSIVSSRTKGRAWTNPVTGLSVSLPPVRRFRFKPGKRLTRLARLQAP